MTPTLKNEARSSRGQFATLENKTARACHFDKSPVLEYQVLARNVKRIPSGELRGTRATFQPQYLTMLDYGAA